MKKGNLGSRFVKKAIAWAMIAMVSASGVVSPLMTANVYAADNEINNYVDELGLSKEHVDSSAAEYHDDEAAKVAESSESVKAMNEQVDKAQEAVKQAEAAVKEAEQAATDAQTAATAAEGAATDAGAAANDGASAANEADNEVKALENKKTPEGIDNYNKQVAKDQNAIDNNQNASAAVTNAEAAAQTAADEAASAEEAADAAKEALEKALAVDTDEVNEGVKAAVQEAKDAAKEAADAADKAKTAKENAEKEAAKAIAEYNLYAMSYGLPLYGETTVTYTEADAKAAVEAAKMTYQAGEKAKLEQEKKDINDTTLDAEKADVDAAVKAFEAAEQAFDAAESSAKEAANAAEAAVQKAEAADQAADAAANAVNDYYVTPAQKAVDDTKDAIDKKNDEISGLNTALETAKKTAVQEGEKKYNDELSTRETAKNDAKTKLDSAQSAYDQAKKDYDNSKGPDKIGYWWTMRDAEKVLNDAKADYTDALSAYNTYNTQASKDKVINDYVSKDAGVTTASTNLDNANKELADLNAQYATQTSVLEAEKATRDAYMQAATQNAGEEARKQFVAEIEKILAQYSAEINQIDYDEALNKWSNGALNTWDLMDKGLVRDEMNGKYVDSALESLFNTLGITQWLVSTKSAEAVMDASRDAYRASIEQYYEKLATAEANWAAMDTEAATNAVEAEAQKLDAVNDTISEAKTAVGAAENKLDKAKKQYDAAATRLENLKGSVNSKSFDSVDLKALQDKIKAAQEAVDKAADELKKAETQKAAAQNYANWANELVKDHYTRAYAQAVTDEEGNKIAATENLKDYDLKNNEVSSRPTKDFVCVSKGTESVKVPYAIYRAYVEAMYAKYDATKNNAGKGISTGDSMDVIFWEVDENGVLTGTYYDSADGLADGRYFIGYSFKHESDGYHIDGVMWDYVTEKEEIPEEEPGDPSDDSIPEGEPGSNPGGNPGGTPTSETQPGGTVTIEDGSVALAAAPAADQAVLGARRAAVGEDAAVLGAKRGVDQAVLGKRRSPGTGDSATQVIWMMLLGVSALTTAAAAMQLKKKAE